QAITKPVYDHATGTFGEPEEVQPRPIVIVRGLFPLFTRRLRDAFDVSVWLDPDEHLKYHWKIQRDVAQRGYLLEEVIGHIVERQVDHHEYIQPQAAFADRVVRFCPSPGYLRSRRDGTPDNSHLNVQIIQRPALPRVNLTDILEPAGDGRRVSVREYEGHHQDASVGVIEIDGDIAAADAARLEDRIWAHMPTHQHLRPDEIGTYLDGDRPCHSDPLALTQLLIAYQIVAAWDRRGLRLSKPVAAISGS
ncbi:MAG TPA: phosphoribulokinase, partial [Chloroflexota bacterium]